MKKLLIVVLAMVVSAAFLTGCDHQQSVTAKGQQQAQTRQLPNFTHLQVKGHYNITIKQGSKASITILAAKNILPYIKTQVVNRILVLETKKGFFINTPSPILISMTTVKIKGVHLSGNNQVKINNIHANTMTLTTAGQAKVTVSGKTKRFYLQAAGQANIVADKLKAKNTILRVTGSGDIKIYAAKDLHAKITGSAKVLYYGNPRVIKPEIVGSAIFRKG